MLAAVVALLLVAGVVAVVVLTRGDDDQGRADDTGASDTGSSDTGASDTGSSDGVDAPHALPSDDERSAAQRFAADAAVTILEVKASRYDAEVDEAAELMTPTFADNYRTTAEGIRQEYVDRKVDVTAKAVAHGLVGIDDERATVLVFVDQTLRRPGTDPTLTPSRAVMVLVRDGDDWLVDAMLTDAAPAEPTEPDAERRAVLAAATATAQAFITIDHHDPQASIDAVLATATGSFAEQYESSSADLVRLTRENHTVMTGSVRAVGIATIAGDTAEVVVATDGEVTNDATGGEPRDNNYRMQLELVRVGDAWLTSDVQFVS